MGHKTLCGSENGKVWGTTRCVYVGPFSETHIINAKAGGYCSQHSHLYKWNRFHVISGKLKITLYKKYGEDVTILTDGMTSDVPPNIKHKFEALQDTLCLEIYWIDELNPKDIQRVTSGGITNNNTNTEDNIIKIDLPPNPSNISGKTITCQPSHIE